MPDLFVHEREIRLKGFFHLAGVDEVGRGSLAGPVMAAAVILPEKVNIGEINDSKLLSPKKRERLAGEIKKVALAWSVGLATVQEIASLNIHRASLLAMQRAVQALEIAPHCLLVDGRFRIPGLAIEQFILIRGDGLSASVAAASILAKVTRDHLMCIFHQFYPQYGFSKHKGYATAQHLKNLSSYGPCFLHREGFQPVKRLAKKE